MMKITMVAAFVALLATPAFAQMTPENNGVSELNNRGTIASAPSYHGSVPSSSPYDEETASYAGGVSPAAPYDNPINAAAHPGANGLNWQPKNGHDASGG